MKITIEVDESLKESQLVLRCAGLTEDIMAIQKKLMDLVNQRQQLLVNRLMIDYFSQFNFRQMNKRVRQYMMNYLDIIMTVSSIMLIKSGTEENLRKKKELWQYLKQKNVIVMDCVYTLSIISVIIVTLN